MVTGAFQKGEMHFTLPDGSAMRAALYRMRAPKIRLHNGEASVELHLKADVFDPETVSMEQDALKALIEERLETEFSAVFAALQRANSDAMGFGRFRAEQFRDVKAWEACDWKSEYRALNVTFSVTVMLSHERRGSETE